MDSSSKKTKLEGYLKELGSIAIAFSGGVDSSFLLTVAHTVLGDQVLAVTARSLSFPKRELAEATRYASSLGVAHIVVDSEELDIDGFSSNPTNRCYMCKTALFTKMKIVAAERGFTHIAEGSNVDDEGDYRPGLQAVQELGVLSPLRIARLTKDEIRQLSLQMNLSTWDKPSFACLSSRFPYGESITPQRLTLIDKAEQHLIDMGFRQVRVRYHGNLARIELDEAGFELIHDPNIRQEINQSFKALGFTYVTFDTVGYRTGSMNETLNVILPQSS